MHKTGILTAPAKAAHPEKLMSVAASYLSLTKVMASGLLLRDEFPSSWGLH